MKRLELSKRKDDLNEQLQKKTRRINIVDQELQYHK
jgi:hypothetical protein